VIELNSCSAVYLLTEHCTQRLHQEIRADSGIDKLEMKTDLLFFIERRVIFDTALKLIRAGKFQATSMTEIAHLAGVDENVALYFFESREKLLRELSGYVTDSISKIVKETVKDELSFQNRFFKVWSALYQYYTQHPGMIAFIEQASVLTTSIKCRITEKDLIPVLEDLFRSAPENSIVSLKRETLASVFHGNVITAAKLYHDNHLIHTETDLKNIALILWSGITSAAFAERRN
jgi:AcrR family transcriptional regulator